MLIALLTVFMLPLKSDAAKGMDEILFYGIEAHLQDTGSVELKYTIEWKVLKDDSDGGVSWVKIGIPNPNAEKFTALSDNIKSVSYMSEGGCFAKVNFKTEYHAGATFRFSVSILQHNLFLKVRCSVLRWLLCEIRYPSRQRSGLHPRRLQQRILYLYQENCLAPVFGILGRRHRVNCKDRPYHCYDYHLQIVIRRQLPLQRSSRRLPPLSRARRRMRMCMCLCLRLRRRRQGRVFA